MSNKIINYDKLTAKILIVSCLMIVAFFSTIYAENSSSAEADSLALSTKNQGTVNSDDKQIFTIKNVSSYGEYGNTGDSKTAAYVSARAQAFKDLLVRIIPKNQLNKITPPNDQEINKMVETQTTTWDRTTSRSYRANFDIQFNQDLVKAWLNNQGIRYTSQYSPRSLIIPILHQDNQYHIWSNKDWYNAWDIANTNFGLLQLQTLQGKLSEVGIVDPQSIMVTQFRSLEPLLHELNATEAAVVFVEPNGYNIEVTVRMINKNNDIIKHYNYEMQQSLDKKELWQRIAADVISRIDMLWKGTDTFSSDKTFVSDAYIMTTRNYTWPKIQKILSTIPFIKSTKVLHDDNNDKNQIKVAITYTIPPAVMSSYLKKYHVTIYKQGDETYLRMEN